MISQKAVSDYKPSVRWPLSIFAGLIEAAPAVKRWRNHLLFYGCRVEGRDLAFLCVRLFTLTRSCLQDQVVAITCNVSALIFFLMTVFISWREFFIKASLYPGFDLFVASFTLDDDFTGEEATVYCADRIIPVPSFDFI